MIDRLNSACHEGLVVHHVALGGIRRLMQVDRLFEGKDFKRN